MTSIFRKNLLGACLVFGLAAPAISAPSKADVNAALALIKTDPAAGIVALTAAADAGSARAASRLAFYTLRGVGVPADADAAIVRYEQAVALGDDRALLSLARVHFGRGDVDAAAETFAKAQRRDVPGARIAYLQASATDRLGPHGEPDAAWAELLTLAHAQTPRAEDAVLYVAAKRRVTIPKEAALIVRYRARAAEGDAKAAERLLRYLRLRTKDGDGYPELRAELLQTPGLRPRIATEEGLYVEGLLNRRGFADAAEDILRTAPQDVYGRALFVTSRIDKNAYVRLIQQDLASLGYDARPINGLMTRRTIGAVNAFCADRDMRETCVLGPLKGSTIKAVTAELAVALAEAGHFTSDASD